MSWLKARPADAHVLADPGHAWKYGTSVRTSAERDVFVEESKDYAVAIYSQDVGHRVTERLAAAANFEHITPERVRDLARQYELDYVVTESDLPLPLAYRNNRFRIYELTSER